jgi:hypothetical protein
MSGKVKVRKRDRMWHVTCDQCGVASIGRTPFHRTALGFAIVHADLHAVRRHVTFGETQERLLLGPRAAR